MQLTRERGKNMALLQYFRKVDTKEKPEKTMNRQLMAPNPIDPSIEVRTSASFTLASFPFCITDHAHSRNLIQPKINIC